MQDYLPIQPSKPHIEGVPTLIFRSRQRPVRNNWVFVKEAYQCATAWIQEAWDENWVEPHLSRRLDHKSLEALALYVKSRGFYQHTYGRFLRTYGVSNHPEPGLRHGVVGRGSLPIASPYPNTFERPPYLGRIEQHTGMYSVPTERTNLLPYASNRSTLVNNRIRMVSNVREEYRPPWFVILISCVIFGILLYGLYVGTRWAIQNWKDFSWPDIGAV